MVPVLAIIFMNQKKSISWAHLAGTCFVLVTIIVNLIHYSYFPVPRFLFSSTYYVYNFMAFIFFSYMFRNYPKEMMRAAYIGLAAVIILQIPHIHLFPDQTWRQTGTFNNPNQLAYWSLLSLIVLVLFRHNNRFNLMDFFLFFVLLYLQTQAISKAGMITFALAVLCLPFVPQMSKMGRIFILLTLCAGVVYGVFNYDKILAIPDKVVEVERVVARLETIGEDEDDNPLVRGYGRLYEFPEYVLLGAGEGAYERFNPVHPNEIHSGLATIVFSYGIAGTAFFAFFLLSILNRQPWYYVFLFGCVFLYSLPHQNIRFTHFWVYLGILDATRHYAKAKRPKVQAYLQNHLTNSKTRYPIYQGKNTT